MSAQAAAVAGTGGAGGAAKRRLIIGMGATGFSVAAYWAAAAAAGHSSSAAAGGGLLTAVDDRKNPPYKARFENALPQVKIRCGENFRRWRAADYQPYSAIAISPGISPHDIKADRRAFTNDVACFEAFYRRARPPVKLLAVTGTNGKSMVTALCAHLAAGAQALRGEAAQALRGEAAQAIGNIGLPVLEALQKWQREGYPAVAAVELSSFQLEIARQFTCDAAVVLNVADDHLDRHSSLAAYADIKKRIYAASRRVIINADAALYPDLSGGADVAYSAAGAIDETIAAARYTITHAGGGGGGMICRNEKPLYALAAMSAACRQYPDNVLAALALTDHLNLPQKQLAARLATFAGLPHRRQVVADEGDSGGEDFNRRRFNALRYVDDSKATNVHAALYALRAEAQALNAPRKIVWLGGGDGKGQDFSPLGAPDVAASMRAAVLLGKDAAKIAAVLQAAGVPCARAADMPAAVKKAAAVAERGDAVLLSPACSSLDMFANYQARGEAFCQAARALRRKTRAAEGGRA